VNQKGTVEGVKRHLESLVSLLAANRTVHTLWHIPVMNVWLSLSKIEWLPLWEFS
jgi:hypothetical protein